MANTLQNKGLTFETLQSALQGEFEVHALDVHDFPLFLAIAAPLSARVTGRKPRLPSGRGLTKAAALIGAAAEAIELRSSLAHKIAAGRYEISRSSGHDEVQVKPLTGEGAISVPAQRIFLDYASWRKEKMLFDADSTGCAAATTLAAAYQSGLLECIERDALATWWYGRQSRPWLPLSLLDPVAPRISWWLSRRDRITLLLDLTSDIRVPCVAAISSDAGGGNVAIGSAASLSSQQAALSAVLEMLQTEVSMLLASASGNPELASWQKGASTRHMPQFQRQPDAARLLHVTGQQMHDALAATGHVAYGIELTLPGDPLTSVRVLVPGLSSMNRKFNSARIAAACGLSGNGKRQFEVLEPF